MTAWEQNLTEVGERVVVAGGLKARWRGSIVPYAAKDREEQNSSQTLFPAYSLADWPRP